MKPQWWVNCKPLAEEALKVGLVVPLARNPIARSSRLSYFSEQKRESSKSDPRPPRKNGTDGSRPFRIGVFLDSYGGVIGYLRISLTLRGRRKM